MREGEMRGLWKFVLLPSADRRILVKAALLIAAVRLGLWLLPFRTVRLFLAHAAPARPGTAGRVSPERIGWAVMGASRYVPRSDTCLIRALAAQALLVWEGWPSRLHIGVARSAVGDLQGHAWIETQGKIVVGDMDDLARYVRLPPL
jgi:hypothetical protein